MDTPDSSLDVVSKALDDVREELDVCRAKALRTVHDLNERVKELTCLYAVSSLLQRAAGRQEVMQGVVDSLAPAYQFPEIACARICLEEECYRTAAFGETPWCQAAAIVLDAQTLGVVEVFYGEPRPEAAEGPFLAEERKLINAVAEQLARYLERERVEAALLASEHKYRTLVDNLYEGIWLLDENGVTTFANARMAEILGVAAEEMIGRQFAEFLDAQDQALAEEHLALGRRGQRSIYEVELTRKDAATIWTRVACKPLFDAKGRYRGSLAGVVDISDRKRAEAALKQSEAGCRRQAAELATVYWLVPVGLAVLDAEWRYLHENRYLAKLNGVPAEEHIGQRPRDIIPSFAEEFEHLLQQIAESGEPALNIELFSKTGARRVWNTQWVPLKDDAGQVWGINVVVEEITERVRAREELYRREQEFEALAEQSPDTIARLDPDGRFVYVNPAFEKVAGEAAAWIIGKRAAEVKLSLEEEGPWTQVVQQVFARGEQMVVEHTVPTFAENRHFQSRVVPEFNRDGRVTSVLVVDRDITELKRAHQTLERLTLQDPLTGIANRRYLEQFIDRQWHHEARSRHSVALLMIDIDRFKAYNDRYGHQAGDECLRRVAHVLNAHLRRSTDLVARYGGEEFVIILPEAGTSDARRIAEEMRTAVAAEGRDQTTSPPVTISLGAAAARADMVDFSALLSTADHALYKAKQAGRNRVEVGTNP